MGEEEEGEVVTEASRRRGKKEEEREAWTGTIGIRDIHATHEMKQYATRSEAARGVCIHTPIVIASR